MCCDRHLQSLYFFLMSLFIFCGNMNMQSDFQSYCKCLQIRYFKNRKLHLDCKSSISDWDMYGNLKTNCFFINFRSFELKKEINFSKA